MVTYHPCIFCLSPGSMKEALDKKGRPFFRCFACGTSAFLHNDRALWGPRLMLEFLNRVNAQQLMQALVGADGQVAAVCVGAVMDKFMTVSPPPQPQPQPQPQTAGQAAEVVDQLLADQEVTHG